MNSTKRYSNFASTQQWRTMNKMFVLALLLPWIAQQKPLQLVDASQTTSHRHLRKDTKINGEDKVNERIPNEDVIRNFVPLSCNSNINTTDCHKWSTKFGTHRIYNVRVIVPCGECITMDHKRDITFNDGLDIVGKLVFPDGYKVNVSSTMIVVQGVLEMKSTQPVTGTPSIRITMIGNNTENSFTPVDENANICGISTCVVGKKGIVVAGGTVDST
jgi:G8 domain